MKIVLSAINSGQRVIYIDVSGRNFRPVHHCSFRSLEEAAVDLEDHGIVDLKNADLQDFAILTRLQG